MPPQPQVITNADMTALFTSVSAAFAQIPYNDLGIAQQIAFMNMGAKGEEIKLPFSPVSNAEKVWQFGSPRQRTKPEIFTATIAHQRYAPDDEMVFVDTLNGDVYGILSGKMPSVVARAMSIMDRRLAAKIGANPVTTYDNVAFWATTHAVNPARPKLGTFSNLLAGNLLDEAGLIRAFDALDQMKGWDGELLCVGGRRVVIVPNERLEVAARRILNPGGLIAQPVGAGAAAGVSTVLSNKADVLLFPHLNAFSTKRWYVAQIVDETLRPFVVSVVRPPEFHYAGTSPDEEIRLEYGAITYGWDCYMEAGFALPQLCIASDEP